MKVIISTLSLLISSIAFAGKVETPASLSGVKIVTAAEAKDLQSKGAVIVDVRKKLEYAESHIKGAISLPYKEKSQKKADFDMSKDKWKHGKLDKSKKHIFQCNGKTCWKSFKASKMAKANGFGEVYWLRGGYPEWKAAGFPVE